MTDWKDSVASVLNGSRMSFVRFTVLNKWLHLYLSLRYPCGGHFVSDQSLGEDFSLPPSLTPFYPQERSEVVRICEDLYIAVREIALPSPFAGIIVHLCSQDRSSRDGRLHFPYRLLELSCICAPKTGAAETAYDIRFEREQESTKQVSTAVSC